MRTIEQLNLGFSDAQNYMQRANKQMFTEVFVKNAYLAKLLLPNTYYLIGEKGTGKTAYAVYLSNTEQGNTKSVLKYISGTDYEKFYELKKRGQIDISGYTDIWKTIILLLLAKSITDKDQELPPFRRSSLPAIVKAIDEYYNNAFSPEIVNALKIVDQSDVAAKLICKAAEIGTSGSNTYEFTEQRLQMNLFYIAKQLQEALCKIKLAKNITLFIDGIDVRPSSIGYNDYLECIKGLANACWMLNTEVFANVRDTKGHFKVVLLLRPDIFNSLNLQNATNKLVDNAVYLDWRTTYRDYPTSHLFRMANKLLAYGQTETVKCFWDTYFDWKLQSSNPEEREYDTAFTEFLKISLSRPRDIQRIVKLIQEIMLERDEGSCSRFGFDAFNSDQFQNRYSEYFLSSLKDQLSFYYSEEDFRHFRKFFEYFKNPQFTYEEYVATYKEYIEYILNNASDLPEFVEDPKRFLQLLYDSNVITAIECRGASRYFHFSYREKSPTNIAPEVPTGTAIQYRFHYGLYKRAQMGRYN